MRLAFPLTLALTLAMSTPAHAVDTSIIGAYMAQNFDIGALEFLASRYAGLSAEERAIWAHRWAVASDSSSAAAKLWWDALLDRFGMVSGLLFIGPYGGAGRPEWEDGGDLHASMRQGTPTGGGGGGQGYEVESDCVDDEEELGEDAIPCNEGTAVRELVVIDWTEPDGSAWCVGVPLDGTAALYASAGQCGGEEMPVDMVVYLD